jgi:haloacid dehalogenase superfamily, subfamily IA, variant 3 with third motif having DD or ED
MLDLADFSAVIFDMDGLVLVHRNDLFYRVATGGGEYGLYAVRWFLRLVVWLSGEAGTQKLLAECGADFELSTFKQAAGLCWHDHVKHHGIAVKHGFHDLLALIIQHDIPYCLATNSRVINALECLALAGLTGVFDLIISRDDVQYGKPAPDIFLHAAACLQVPIERCLVLEDSHAGIVAATQAGAFSVFIPSMLPIDPLTLALCDVMLPDLRAVRESFRA